MAESIDALMDIYAEDNTNRLAADIQLVPKLQSLVSNFKKKVNLYYLSHFVKIEDKNLTSLISMQLFRRYDSRRNHWEIKYL